MDRTISVIIIILGVGLTYVDAQNATTVKPTTVNSTVTESAIPKIPILTTPNATTTAPAASLQNATTPAPDISKASNTPNVTTTPPPPYVPKVVCYYNKDSQNRKTVYSVSDVDFTLCSHVIYDQINLDRRTMKIDNSSLGADIQAVKHLSSKDLITMLSVGRKANSTYDSDGIATMIHEFKYRKEFIDSTIRLVKELGFQGVDINLDYPNCWICGSDRKEADRANFVNLLNEFHTSMNFYGLKLSVAVPVIATKEYDLSALASNVDWVNLITFDFNNGAYNFTEITSPFSGDAPNTVTVVHDWLSAGAHPSKLVIGIPTFGRTFTLDKAGVTNGTGLPATIGKPTQLGEPGFAAYFEICTGLNYGTVESAGKYAFKGDQWVSFDDPLMVETKGKFISENRLGGGMIWSLDTDDFGGTICQQQKYPIVRALRKGLGLLNV